MIESFIAAEAAAWKEFDKLDREVKGLQEARDRANKLYQMRRAATEECINNLRERNGMVQMAAPMPFIQR